MAMLRRLAKIESRLQELETGERPPPVAIRGPGEDPA
jgi:hypothetical protein